MYDNYVSLGENCEIAFNFRRIFGEDRSGYFNWLVTPLDSLIEILRNDFANEFLAPNLYHKGDQIGMVTDRLYDISHHSPFKEIGGQLAGEAFEAKYRSQCEKLKLFKDRFRQNCSSTNFSLYFLKIGTFYKKSDRREKSIIVRDLILERYPNHNFNIVVIQDAPFAEPQWDDERLFNRYLDRFAPYNNVPDFHQESWDRIFAEFPLRDGLGNSTRD